jgi:hypothetical protein
MDFNEKNIPDQVMIHEADWTIAAITENIEELGILADDLEAHWGLEFIGYGYDDITCDFLNYKVIDKHKFFLAKIKHGF